MKGNLKENLDIKNWRPISMHRILKNPKKAMMNDPLKFLQSLAKKKKENTNKPITQPRPLAPSTVAVQKESRLRAMI